MKKYEGYKLWNSSVKSKKFGSLAIESFKRDKIYCLKKLGDDRYQMLNRYYVPVGQSEETYRSLCSKGEILMEVRTIKGIDHYFDRDMVHFYDSSTLPYQSDRNWQNYCSKLDKFNLIGWGY